MAASCQEFSSSVSYALSQLGKPHLILKDEQRRSMQAVFDGRDVFVCFPTGFGKSLCYQALSFIFDRKYEPSGAVNCVIVFSPLVALMVDQVECLRKNFVHGSGNFFW